MRVRTLTFASIAVIGMGMTFLATPAQAAEKDRHCVTNMSAPNTPTTCYDSFTEAIAKATDGRVTDAPDNARKAANDPRLQTQLNSRAINTGGKATPQTASPIEIAWEDTDFGGNTWIFSTNRDCTATLDDIDFSEPYLNFGIRSFRNYRGCASKHYEFPNFEGRSVGWISGGELPFPARSVQWS
jgi:hypothetical protein